MAKNLCPNPSCTNNVTGWLGSSPARITGLTGTPRTTGASVSMGTGSFSSSLGCATAVASSGQTWTAVGWVRSSVARTIRVALVTWQGTSFVSGGGTGATDIALAADTWTQVRVTGTLGSATFDGVNYHLDLPTTGTAGTLSLSSCRLEMVSDPTLVYADGDTAGWTWDGTAGNSTSQTTSAVTLTVRNARSATRATRPLLSVPAGGAPAVVIPRSRSGWKFLLGPAIAGGWKWDLVDAKARRAVFRLRGNSEASLRMRGDDPIAVHLAELATDLHLLRTDANGVTSQLYRGRVGGVSDELDGTKHSVTVPSLDYRAVLQRRHLMSGSQVTWTQQDQYAIAFGLITQAQNKTGGSYGIVDGSTPSGVLRDRTYELGDSIGQRLQELSEVENGFDWDIVPTGPSGLTFTAWRPERGMNRGVVLDYGGLVKSITRSVDSGEYANAIRVTGQPPEGSTTEPPPHEGVATGITDPLLFPQGRWDKVIGTSIVLTNTLAERRTWLLDHHQVIRPSYSAKLTRGAWKGPDHIWLGDWVRLRINSGRLAVDTTLRVHEIAVDISDDGAEDVTLAIGAPRPDFRRRSAANEKRIEELERR